MFKILHWEAEAFFAWLRDNDPQVAISLAMLMRESNGEKKFWVPIPAFMEDAYSDYLNPQED